MASAAIACSTRFNPPEALNRMDVTKIPPGRNPPEEINVLVEIPQGGVPVKYELDKVSGALFVNRFLHTAMYYPANYGFIPNTLSEDGDPCDVLALSQVPVAPSAVIRCRPVGALLMEDENGIDEKILAVPVDELNPYFDGIANYTDLPKIMLDQIDHFFRHYKDLEKGKWVKVGGWVDREAAGKLILDAIARVHEK
jgi:inorganic pyrophosphatase